MGNLSLKQKIISAVLAIGIALIVIFTMGLGGKVNPTLPPDRATKTSSSAQNIEVVSTTPTDLKDKKDLTILPTQALEFTFNQPLENIPETKITIEPQTYVKVNLSDDKKTVKITPDKPFALGQGYTLFFKGNTKFQGGKQLGSDMDFHFTTIAYNGV